MTVVALELLRRRVADTTERRLAGDVLAALVSRRARGRRARAPPGAVRPRRARQRARARAGERALRRAPSRPRSPRRCATRPSAGSSPARAARLRAAAAASLDDELFELAERVLARVARGARRRRCAAGAGRAVAAGDARRGFHEARCALEARELGAGRRRRNGHGGAARRRRSRPTATSAPSSCCSRCRTPTRCACSASRCSARSRAARATTAASSMRSLEAFIECNGQWEAAARRLYCHRHTLRYRIRKVEELTGRDLGLAPATASSSGSPCAAASSSRPPSTRERQPMKVGVPTEIKTDEYRVALTPVGRARAGRPRPRGASSRRARARARRSPTTTTSRRARAIVPDADAVFAEAEMIVKVKEPQPVEVARLEPRHTLFTYLHLAPDAELDPRPRRLGRDLHRLRDGRPTRAGGCRCWRR